MLGKTGQFAEGIDEKGRNLTVLESRLEIAVINLFHPRIHRENVETVESEKHYAIGNLRSHTLQGQKQSAGFVRIRPFKTLQVEAVASAFAVSKR